VAKTSFKIDRRQISVGEHDQAENIRSVLARDRRDFA
jgi:hypothetical protein